MTKLTDTQIRKSVAAVMARRRHLSRTQIANEIAGMFDQSAWPHDLREEAILQCELLAIRGIVATDDAGASYRATPALPVFGGTGRRSRLRAASRPAAAITSALLATACSTLTPDAAPVAAKPTYDRVVVPRIEQYNDAGAMVFRFCQGDECPSSAPTPKRVARAPAAPQPIASETGGAPAAQAIAPLESAAATARPLAPLAANQPAPQRVEPMMTAPAASVTPATIKPASEVAAKAAPVPYGATPSLVAVPANVTPKVVAASTPATVAPKAVAAPAPATAGVVPMENKPAVINANAEASKALIQQLQAMQKSVATEATQKAKAGSEREVAPLQPAVPPQSAAPAPQLVSPADVARDFAASATERVASQPRLRQPAPATAPGTPAQQDAKLEKKEELQTVASPSFAPAPFRVDPQLIAGAKPAAAVEPTTPMPAQKTAVTDMVPREKVEQILDWMDEKQRQQQIDAAPGRFVKTSLQEAGPAPAIDIPVYKVEAVKARQPGQPLPPETVSPKVEAKPAPAKSATPAPPITPAAQQVSTSAQDAEAGEPEGAIRKWARAWSARDSQSYFAFYADTFKAPDGTPPGKWKERRGEVMAHAKTIDVSVDIIKVATINDKASVRFIQSYRSPTFNSRVIKQVDLVRLDGTWKILSERIAPVA